MRAEVVIYTANLGQVRELQATELEKACQGADFICFTDSDDLLTVPPWKIIKVDRQFEDPTRDSRYLKIMGHPALKRYKYTIWKDSNVFLRDSHIAQHIESLMATADIALHRHPLRKCTFEEGFACIRLQKDSVKTILGQLCRYRFTGFPARLGLADTGAIIRRNDSREIKDFNKRWWRELARGSRRDQISLYYAIWRTGLNPYVLEGSVDDGPKFTRTSHKDGPSRAKYTWLDWRLRRFLMSRWAKPFWRYLFRVHV